MSIGCCKSSETPAPASASSGSQVAEDSETSGTPISLPVDTDTTLTNDGLGAGSSEDYLPDGIPSIWDADNNQFDFSSLSLGDIVTITIDIDVTTTIASSLIDVDLNFGEGGTPFKISLFSLSIPTVRTVRIVRSLTFTLIDDNTRLNPCRVIAKSSLLASAIVRKWHIAIWRHSV